MTAKITEMKNAPSAQNAPSGDAPAPYIIRRANKWIYADADSDLAGFAIKVRQYITNAERDDIIDETNKIRQYSADYIRTLDLKKREELAVQHGGTPRDVEWSYLAPYIVEWNFQAETAESTDDEPAFAPVPAPADGGPDVFKLIPNEHYVWIYNQVINGYRAMGKAGTTSDDA